jgi:hypothetical protein
MPEGSDPTDLRNGLREVFQTLADKLRGEDGQSRDIAARLRQAGDEPARHRIGNKSEENGEGPGRLLRGQGGGCGCGHDDMNLERNQFGRKSGEPLELPLGISVFDYEVATLDVTEVTQPLAEGLLEVRDRVGRQVAYSKDLGRLLRPRGKRRRERTSQRVSRKRRRSMRDRRAGSALMSISRRDRKPHGTNR